MKIHLRRARTWLFGRRPVRPHRPMRRGAPLVFALACAIAYVTGPSGVTTAVLAAGVFLLLLFEVI